jgi:hypothetical protein
LLAPTGKADSLLGLKVTIRLWAIEHLLTLIGRQVLRFGFDSAFYGVWESVRFFYGISYLLMGIKANAQAEGKTDFRRVRRCLTKSRRNGD